MLILLNSSKSMDESKIDFDQSSSILFPNKVHQLITRLQSLSKTELQALMKTNEQLTQLNYNRYQQFADAPEKQAIFLFSGTIYNGFALDSYDKTQLHYLQNHVRILSGLYGILRPFDIIKPYRMEMGYDFDLYDFWSQALSNYINDNTKVIINLASAEYFSVLKGLKCKIITPTFLDYHNGTWKTVAIYAKKARGVMAHFMIKNTIQNIDALKQFKELGYVHDNQARDMVFKRKEKN